MRAILVFSFTLLLGLACTIYVGMPYSKSSDSSVKVWKGKNYDDSHEEEETGEALKPVLI